VDLSTEDLWKEGSLERAISLVAVRKLLFERADGLIGPDRAKIHGKRASIDLGTTLYTY
jgi:hypothetical protein